MSTLEQEIVDQLHQLNADEQHKVLAFIETLKEPPAVDYSLAALMKLPVEERERRVIEALASSANEDFEIFEAYDDEDFDDEP